MLNQQNERLFRRIQQDSKRVQYARAEAWTRFDSRQLSVIFDYVFQHLAKDDGTPFDFSKCRNHADLPETFESHISQFLRHSLQDGIDSNFKYAADVVGSSLVRYGMKVEGANMIYNPTIIFSEQAQKWCSQAMGDFLDNNVQCSYVQPETGEKCVNTKAGHTRGHQDSYAKFLAYGAFVAGDFNTSKFHDLVKSKQDTNHEGWKTFATNLHRSTLQLAGNSSFWTKHIYDDLYARKGTKGSFKRTNTCFACLFSRPEYRLPCGHLLCDDCLQDFGERDAAYPDMVIHKMCILCSNASPPSFWPVKVRIRPQISGTRVLSLDGGGVRGIVELEILRRLEVCIGLGLPIWYFFDLIVGTSGGGLIALGIGIHRWNAENCIKKFHEICNTGFSPKFLTTVFGLGPVFRWIRGCIYDTSVFEQTLQRAFPLKTFFGLLPAQIQGTGLLHCPRVAITTTVGSESKLFTNYSAGGATGEDYLNSSLPAWKV
ncbi:hypothetical protein AOQ84DRAFT_295988 [Glonium stellatum]|uniref:PNPLA domain-containing protein n=1 Tax=Glonium stellatum TaxID=574774 RepID=A0A8E2JRI4_9PEZI|nr:hypothetical protein AOQ84DRAFT_295988 [Glonium stellatum]